MNHYLLRKPRVGFQSRHEKSSQGRLMRPSRAAPQAVIEGGIFPQQTLKCVLNSLPSRLSQMFRVDQSLEDPSRRLAYGKLMKLLRIFKTSYCLSSNNGFTPLLQEVIGEAPASSTWIRQTIRPRWRQRETPFLYTARGISGLLHPLQQANRFV
jgi:hypothetical protein